MRTSSTFTPMLGMIPSTWWIRSGEETVCAADGSSCITVVTTQQSSGKAVTAGKGPASGKTGLGNSNIDVAASEVAGELNQQRGDERFYRADETTISDVSIVVTKEVPTNSAGPSSASYNGKDVAGADAVFHTEPERENTGIPGDGDIETPVQANIPNYAFYGENATAIELNNGTVQLRPVNHRGKLRPRNYLDVLYVYREDSKSDSILGGC